MKKKSGSSFGIITFIKYIVFTIIIFFAGFYIGKFKSDWIPLEKIRLFEKLETPKDDPGNNVGHETEEDSADMEKVIKKISNSKRSSDKLKPETKNEEIASKKTKEENEKKNNLKANSKADILTKDKTSSETKTKTELKAKSVKAKEKKTVIEKKKDNKPLEKKTSEDNISNIIIDIQNK